MSKLTPQERVVMAWVAEGLTNQEIASKMWLSINTIKVHIASVRAKLAPGAGTTRISLVKLCRDNGEIA